jgi:uncharacterized protein (TIGR02145 family)
MAIPPKQIGWSQKSNLLWEVSRELDRLLSVIGGQGNTVTNTTTVTTTLCFNCVETPVVIGTQTWDKCNLDVTTYANGDPIPQAISDEDWLEKGATGIGAWCYYNNDPSNGDTYGKLYNWYAVNDPRGLAPVGKRVPNNVDWTFLIDELGGLTNLGGQLKETGLCHWLSPNAGATNSSGFTAFGAGVRYNNSIFSFFNELGVFWSATEGNIPDTAFFMYIYTQAEEAIFSSEYKGFGFSVRCLLGDPVNDFFTYTPDNTTIIANPERGLQYFTQNVSGGSYSPINQSTLITNRLGADKVTVIYRYIILTDYMSTDTIDSTYLDNLQLDFTRIRNAGVKVILRIAYNITTQVNTQPSKDRIIAHIVALSSTINANKDVIVSVQAGSIGTYGEWYYTDGSIEFGDVGIISPLQWANRKEVTDAMLNNFDSSITIQVRYATAKREMYGDTFLTELTAFQPTPNARVGFYNDAFLNEDGDMGTYNISNCITPVGTTDYNFIANAGKYLPMNGESNGINPCDSGFRTTGNNALFELNELNFSTLNRAYNPDVWDGWIADGVYDTIVIKLGYRIQLLSLQIDVTSTIDVALTLQNVGCANILKEKTVYLVFVSGATEYKKIINTDVRFWTSTHIITDSLVNDIPSGPYDLYLHIEDANLVSRPEYSIRVANSDITFDPVTGYNNLLSQVTI